MHTRYVRDFSGLTNYSQKLWNPNKAFVSCFVCFFGFLSFDPRWILWCPPRKEVSSWDCLLISKASYLTVYPEKLFAWPPVCLWAFQKVASFFICFWSELVTEVVCDFWYRFLYFHFHLSNEHEYKYKKKLSTVKEEVERAKYSELIIVYGLKLNTFILG